LPLPVRPFHSVVVIPTTDHLVYRLRYPGSIHYPSTVQVCILSNWGGGRGGGWRVEGGHELRHSCNAILPIRSLRSSVDQTHRQHSPRITRWTMDIYKNTITSHVLISAAYSLRSAYCKFKKLCCTVMCRCVFLQPLPHKSQLAIRFQFDDNTTVATFYEPRILMVIYSGDIGLHSFSMNMLADEADTFVIWCMRRFEKGKTKIKYGVHPSVSKSSEVGTFIVGRKPDWDCEMFSSFYGVTEKSFKSCPFLNNKDLQSHGK